MNQHKNTLSINPDEKNCWEISDAAVLSKAPLVSVIMITYNHASHIATAIRGVLLQKTDFPIELVVGEDCSTDATRDIVLEYQRKHPDIVRVVSSEKNVGMHANFCRTLNLCRGKYLAFCEGDDYWHNEKKLQMQIDYLESHPQCGLVHSDVDQYNVRTKTRMPSFHKERRLLSKYKNILHSMIVNEYVVETCTAVIRKEMYDDICATCTYEYSDKFVMRDVQTWMEIAYRSQVKYIDESLATRNLLPESACRSRNVDKVIRFMKNARDIAMHYADKYGGQDAEDLKKAILTHFNSLLMRTACQGRKFALANELLEYSQKHHVILSPLDYLYYFSTKNNIVSNVARAFLMFMGRCRRSLARVRWLRAMREIIK